jgi:uncharacterized membrane protein YbhN (UPF0104 family)
MQADAVFVLAAASLFILSSTLVALALYVPLRQSNPKVPIGKVVMASFGGQLLSDVTPARSGYFLTPIFVNRLANVPIEQGMTGVLVTGSINALLKATICLLGLGYFISYLPLPTSVVYSLIVGVAVLLIAGVFLLLLMWEKRMSKIVAKFEKLPLIGEKLHKVTEMFANIQQQSIKVKRSFGLVALLILASLIVNATALYCVFIGLWHTPALGLLEFFLLASFASALTYVPITVAGLGVQETGYILLLQLLLGMSLTVIDPKLLAFAFITRILFTGTDIIGLNPLIKIGLNPESSKKH